MKRKRKLMTILEAWAYIALQWSRWLAPRGKDRHERAMLALLLSYGA